MKKLLFALAVVCLFAAAPTRAFDTVRSSGRFVVFEDKDGIGCWCLAKDRIIEFFLSRDEEQRTTSVVLIYDSGKIAVAHRRKAGNATGNDVSPGEMYQFTFRNTDDAQRFIRLLLAAVSAD